MKNIVWTRIDDRLIHGQVMTAWVQQTKGNEIEIVDDEVANDAFLKMVTTSTAPKSVEVRVDTLEKAAEYLKGNDNGKRVMILVKTPEVIYNLIEKGVKISHVNVGGMGNKSGRTQLYRNISASDSERETFKSIVATGTKVGVQVLPENTEADIEKFL